MTSMMFTMLLCSVVYKHANIYLAALSRTAKLVGNIIHFADMLSYHRNKRNFIRGRNVRD